MKKITWTTKEIDVKLLKGYTHNPRDITDKNLELLKDSIETYGQVVPLVVNLDLTVLGGNQRMKVIEGKVKIKAPDRVLTEQEQKELVIILNNKLGDWDFFKVEALGFDIDTLITEFGFDEEYIQSNQINLDDFGLDDFNPDFKTDEEKLIKQFVLNFTGLEDNLQELLDEALEKEKVNSLENLVLKKARQYANDNA